MLRLVNDERSMKTMCDSLKGCRSFAVDTESDSMYRYRGRLCIIQVYDGKATWIVDSLAVKPCDYFLELLEDPDIEKILHGADYDIRMAAMHLKVKMRGVFDTYTAATLLGREALGLDALVKEFYDVTLDKSLQKADWGRRPLSQDMISYAALDTRYLMGIRTKLSEELKALNRMSWAEEEFRHLELSAGAGMNDEVPHWSSMKGAGKLDTVSRAILSRLHSERERRAKAADTPPGMMISGKKLLELIKAKPHDADELAALPPWMAKKWGKVAIDAVRWAESLTPSQMKEFQKPESKGYDPEQRKLSQELSKIRDKLLDGQKISPPLVCSRAVLDLLAEHKPADRKSFKEITGLRDWQLNLLADELIQRLSE